MSAIRLLDSRAAGFDAALDLLLRFDTDVDSSVDQAAAAILQDVKTRGDDAVLEYTRRFDRFEAPSMTALEVTKQQMAAALAGLDGSARQALQDAARRITDFHERQKADSWLYSEEDGSRFGQRVTALDSVGIYVPGGKASYPSSVLMNALPARVAGVHHVVMVAPTPDGERNAMVLAAAAVANVDRLFCIGGAQAIGALAFGTSSVPAVDKIVGPGNAYVAAAKRRVFGQVGIDMIAGPSEVLIVADGSAPAEWVAMDLFAQAEHDEVSQAILLSPNAAYVLEVQQAIDRLLPTLSRRAIVTAALNNRAALITVTDMDEACRIANRIAPEHLELSVADPEALLPQIRHAGAIFMGIHSSEAVGDYCAGPNHVLPTARTARFSSPLGVYDFQKRSSIVSLSRVGARQLGTLAATLATSEGLSAHARSALYRVDD